MFSPANPRMDGGRGTRRTPPRKEATSTNVAFKAFAMTTHPYTTTGLRNGDNHKGRHQ